MKAHELRDNSTEELENELESLKENLFNQRSRSILGQLEDTTLIGKIRKDIARVKTVLHARELETQD
jgi:large subunit ribosomal protein L29